jgi:hypothetical protein
MKKYRVNVYQNITYELIVDAENEAAAKDKLLSGKVGLTYADVVNEDYDYMTVEEVTQ